MPHESRSSVDSTRPESSSPRLRSNPSSSSFRFSKSRCAICLCEIRKEDGKAIFTAECSHSFHFDCITYNVKHGNRICPLCRTQWKQVPLFDVNPLVPTFPAQRGFKDDEFLPHGETQSQSDDHHCSDRQALEVKLFPEVSALAKPVTRNDFAVLVHLKAKGVNDADRRTRAPLDLITVLVVSGSMEGVKLELMKQAMGFVIQNLGETDRLSVIAFSSTARRLFPLRLMSETGEKAAMQAVNSLVSGGGKNIAEGLKIGARVIEDRRWKNPVSGMMLLSDGQDNYTLSHGGVRLRSDFESLLPSSCRIPIHTFGVFEGFSASRILEQVVDIECLDEQGLKMSSIKAGSYRSRIASDARKATIDVGDMYAEEERDFLVILEISCCDNHSAEAESMSLLKIRCVYKDPVTKETGRVGSGEVRIQRPMELTGEEVLSIEVDRKQNRFLVSQAMTEAKVLADGGDMSAAVEILKKCARELSETASARSSDSLCQSLSSELSALQERMASRRIYRESGQAYALSTMSSHSRQRAAACGTRVGLCAGRGYQTKGMAHMLSMSRMARKP